MTDFTASDVRRFVLTSVGALLFSATCIAGAVAPARAAEPATPNAPLTVGDWQAEVGNQLDAKLRVPANGLTVLDHWIARVDVSFDRNGVFTGAKVAQPSGSGPVDREAVRVARAIAYPPLPAGYRGRPQTVTMQVYFGEAATQEAANRHAAAVKALASGTRTHHDAVQTAALPSG